MARSSSWRRQSIVWKAVWTGFLTVWRLTVRANGRPMPCAWTGLVSLAIWSAFTAICGLATDINIGGMTIVSGFVFLLVARMGVGLGEAGGDRG